jgi:hypothetical protein
MKYILVFDALEFDEHHAILCNEVISARLYREGLQPHAHQAMGSLSISMLILWREQDQ